MEIPQQDTMFLSMTIPDQNNGETSTILPMNSRPRSLSLDQQQKNLIHSTTTTTITTQWKKPRLYSDEFFEENRHLAMPQQEPLCGDANQSSAHILLEFFKLYQTRLLTDATLVCLHGEEIFVHASLLYAVCPALGAKFLSNSKSSLDVSSFPIGTVRKIVEFLYTRETLVVRNQTELAELTQCASVLEVILPKMTVCSTPRFSCTHTLLGHMGYVCCLAVLQLRPGYLLSGSRDNSLRVWKDKVLVKELNDIHSDRIWALLSVLSSSQQQERVLVGSWDGTISVIRPGDDYEVESRLLGHTDWVTCLCQLGPLLLVASGSADGTVRIWKPNAELTQFRPERVLRGHRGHVYALASNPNGSLLFSAGNDGYICVWETAHFRRLERLSAHCNFNIRTLVWSSELMCLLSGASDGRIRAWNCCLSGGGDKFQMRQDIKAHTDWVEALVEMTKSRVASGSRDCAIRIWRATSTEWDLLQHINQHSHWVYALLFHNDTLYSASCDMKIKVWKEETAAEEEEDDV